MCCNPVLCKISPSEAYFELWKPEKKNYPLLRALDPRPTSQRKWGGEPVFILGRFWVYQRSDWCSRTIWAPRILEKIWRCSSYYFIYNFSKTRCSNGVDCRVFKWISPFEDWKYLSKNKSLWTKVTNLTIHINGNHGVLLKLKTKLELKQCQIISKILGSHTVPEQQSDLV